MLLELKRTPVCVTVSGAAYSTVRFVPAEYDEAIALCLLCLCLATGCFQILAG